MKSKIIKQIRIYQASIRGAVFDIFGKKICFDQLAVESPEQLKDEMLSYAIKTFFYRTDESVARTYVSGVSSCGGPLVDQVECCARLLPVIASVLARGPERYSFEDEVIYEGLLNKFILTVKTIIKPESEGGWSNPQDYDQMICEMSDVCIALKVSWYYLEPEFSVQDIENLVDWLNLALEKEVVDNNWVLFKATISAFLSSISSASYDDLTNDLVSKVHFYARADGWFVDGDQGPIDFYTAWGFYYQLFILYKVFGNYIAGEFFGERFESFVVKYNQLFQCKPFPLYGRSPVYCLGVVVPLFIYSVFRKGAYNNYCLKIFQQVYKDFYEFQTFKNGRLVEDIYRNGDFCLDVYSSSSSAYWGYRPLIIFNLFEDVSGGCEQAEVDYSEDPVSFNESGIALRFLKDTVEFEKQSYSYAKRDVSLLDVFVKRIIGFLSLRRFYDAKNYKTYLVTSKIYDRRRK